MTAQRYVCGFLFDSPIANVALIQKNRGPANMAGHLNGIGGKMELGETPRGAQAREFKEETGVWVPPEDWSCFHVERYIETGAKVYFMTATSLLFHTCKTMEDEEVILTNPDVFMFDGSRRCMYNLCYLIPMAQVWLQRPKDRFFED